jgi:hypothetical protein
MKLGTMLVVVVFFAIITWVVASGVSKLLNDEAARNAATYAEAMK